MAGKTDYFENLINNYIFQGGPALPNYNQDTGTGIYLSLYTVLPTADDGTGGTEVTGNNYARKVIDHGTVGNLWVDGDFGTYSAAGTISNTVAITFNQATPAGWGTVVGMGVWDAVSGGNLLYFQGLSGGSIIVNAGDTPRFAAGALTIVED